MIRRPPRSTLSSSSAASDVYKRQVVDIIDVAKIVASFSVLKVVRVASISFIQERLIPRFQMAVSCWDYIRAVIFVIGWAVLVVVAGGAVVLKVSQVYFTGVISIEEWTIGQVVQLIGLVSNLAKVDTSYDAETAALLSAVHKHYRGPGGPDSLDPKNEGLYSLILTKLDIPRSRSYELFESVFDYHFGKEDKKKSRQMRDKKKTVSYTHLRAHETPEHLVCRLLLEKKKHKNTSTQNICDIYS
eukprot:TRINITY_DN19345_c0_g1_i1.p1 TRINITY_DN19345_c0_g1~~TRINITY_DN19345_c0_g1_i1.p1  ORF type:complete len:244 (-),score=43.87 TRINITY_DN19345_c0_g1_i1:90-821(-)